jgi:PPOX class probable F420-dependent enzyme
MHARTRELLEGPNYAALTFLLPSGTPSTHMMWVGVEGDEVLINTEVHRFKFRNMAVGSKTTVMVFENNFSWAEVRGTVVAHTTGDRARAHIDELAQVYTGAPYANEIQSERVIIRIRPDHDMPFPPG